jgi:hypothetical protein
LIEASGDLQSILTSKDHKDNRLFIDEICAHRPLCAASERAAEDPALARMCKLKAYELSSDQHPGVGTIPIRHVFGRVFAKEDQSFAYVIGIVHGGSDLFHHFPLGFRAQ